MHYYQKMFGMGIPTLVFMSCLLSGQSFAHARSRRQAVDPEPISKHYFLNKLLAQYGDGEYLTVQEVQKLLETLKRIEEQKAPSEKERIQRNAEEKTQLFVDTNRTCDASDDWVQDPDCLDTLCMSAVRIFKFHEVSTDRVNASVLHEISPTILYSAQTLNCVEKQEPTGAPKAAEVWGYSFVCVTIINLCSLMGMVFLPLMHKRFYKKLLMFMVALAVGTLSGSSLLFLIPECFDMASEDNPYFHDYVWKCTTVIGGIYMFFVLERILKNIMDWRKKRENGELTNLDNPPMSSVKMRDVHRNESINMSFSIPRSPKQNAMSKVPSSTKELVRHQSECSTADVKDLPVTFDLGESGLYNRRSRDDSRVCSASSCRSNVYALPTTQCAKSDNKGQPIEDNACINNGLAKHSDNTPSFGQIQSNISSAQLLEDTKESAQSSTLEISTDIKSVAWMVIFGDGLHNFIDGLSIGAAFSKNILAGVSVALAVMCEELPHELGDFAILLSSGMSLRQAIGYNFLSACTCYMGLVVGILVGEMTTGSTWIFALAGGMFLYISLVDMLPEVNHASEEEAKSTGHAWRVFFLQNAGLLTGYGIILLLAVFSDRISLEADN